MSSDCTYPSCDCTISFPGGYVPSTATECPKNYANLGEPRVIHVFNGTDRLGSVYVDRSIRATDNYGFEIGRYSTIEEARAAVVRAAFKGRPDAATG